MAKWTGKKVNVSFSKPEEPAFLKRFKERVGYREDHGLGDKFAQMPEMTQEDTEDKDDELPQVVKVRAGDLSAEEVENLRAEGILKDLLDPGQDQDQDFIGPKLREGEQPPDGKILFRKPVKRSKEEEEEGEQEQEDKRKKKKKKKQNKTLLSFDEDDQDDQD